MNNYIVINQGILVIDLIDFIHLRKLIFYISCTCILLLGIRGPIADQYADQQRADMLSKIVDLELEMKEKENTITSLCKEFEEKQSQYEERISGTYNHF